MNNSLAVPNQGPWPVGQYAPDAQLGPGQRTYSATNILDFATLVRILHHWRWLVLGAVALGLAAAILATLLTTPVYRASVTLEANPPMVAVTDEQSREREASNTNSYDFVATQVGLLKSKAVAQRTAQELNLANSADIVPQDIDASKRLQIATGIVRGAPRAQAEEYRKHDARRRRHRKYWLYHPDRTRRRLSGAPPGRIARLGNGRTRTCSA